LYPSTVLLKLLLAPLNTDKPVTAAEVGEPEGVTLPVIEPIVKTAGLISLFVAIIVRSKTP
jgi:hypothetical protein